MFLQIRWHPYQLNPSAPKEGVSKKEFYQNKFVEFGISYQRIVHIPNFLDRTEPKVCKNNDTENYFLYFGRLSEEKGIITLVKAMDGIEKSLYIVGTGPLEKSIQEYISNRHLSNIDLCGFKSGQELVDIVGNAKAVVLPSEWYENGPYSAIEALQLGRPIIGANIGGIPELIHKNGYLFESGSVVDLHNCLMKIMGSTEEEYKNLQGASKTLFNEQYSPDSHYERIIKVYNMAIEKHKYSF